MSEPSANNPLTLNSMIESINKKLGLSIPVLPQTSWPTFMCNLWNGAIKLTKSLGFPAGSYVISCEDIPLPLVSGKNIDLKNVTFTVTPKPQND